MLTLIPNRPLVSVVTPSFNQGEYIDQTIESVLSQNYSLIEHIVMDGGSTDQSIEILSHTEAPWPKIFRWTSQPDGGQAMAINQGFCTAKGSILCWLNSDDILLPGAISQIVAYFSTNPDHIMVYGDAMWINEAGLALGAYPVRPPGEAYALRNGCFLCQPAVFFRSDIIQEIGLLDPSLVTAMDYDYWIRAFKTFPDRIGYMPKCLALSRLHDDCKTVAQRELVFLESMAVVNRHFSNTPVDWIVSYIEETLEKQKQTREFYTKQKALGLIKKAMRYYDKKERAAIKSILRKDRRLALNSDFLTVDVTNDGWTSTRCIIVVKKKCHFNTIHFSIMHARPIDMPLAITIHSNGRLLANYNFSGNGEYSLSIPLEGITRDGETTTFELSCDSTFIPSEIDPCSTDNRILGVVIRDIQLQYNEV